MQYATPPPPPTSAPSSSSRRPLLPSRHASANSVFSNKPPLAVSSSSTNASTAPALARSKSHNSPGLLSAHDFALMRPHFARTPLSRRVGISLSRPDTSPTDTANAPFRRSNSKPELPTSNIGARAIEAASRACAHASGGKKLIFMRNFSVSEEDVVVCNRNRSSAAFALTPVRLRQRGAAHDRRYLRSLSVEESRLVTMRRRANLLGIDGSGDGATSTQLTTPPPTEQLPLADSDPFAMTIDPLSDAYKATATAATRKADAVAASSKSPRSLLSAREQAMHGRYLIRESFANGSYGNVCAGEATASPHHQVAVKIVPKSVLISKEEKQSVVREQIIHRSLNHPHIIQLLDVFEDDSAHYFVLERADNGALATLLSCAGLPEQHCRDVFTQLLQALAYLHSHQIVHHDVKPHNILLTSKNGVKLCDFGASRAFCKTDRSLEFAGVFGTPGYIAPELLMGDAAYGTAIDLFSAGVVLFEMLFGYAPFYPPSSCTYMPLEVPTDGSSAAAKQLLRQLLQRDPAKRVTAAQALSHPWIVGSSDSDSSSKRDVKSPIASPRSRLHAW